MTTGRPNHTGEAWCGRRGCGGAGKHPSVGSVRCALESTCHGRDRGASPGLPEREQPKALPATAADQQAAASSCLPPLHQKNTAAANHTMCSGNAGHGRARPAARAPSPCVDSDNNGDGSGSGGWASTRPRRRRCEAAPRQTHAGGPSPRAGGERPPRSPQPAKQRRARRPPDGWPALVSAHPPVGVAHRHDHLKPSR